jgi:hypothetical protein
MYCLEDYMINIKENNNNKQRKKYKKIIFNSQVSVILIPRINIHSNYELVKNLWWSSKELLSFKQSCLEEIVTLINRHKSMTPQQASKLLHQPGNMTIVYDKKNFD